MQFPRNNTHWVNKCGHNMSANTMRVVWTWGYFNTGCHLKVIFASWFTIARYSQHTLTATSVYYHHYILSIRNKLQEIFKERKCADIPLLHWNNMQTL